MYETTSETPPELNVKEPGVRAGAPTEPSPLPGNSGELTWGRAEGRAESKPNWQPGAPWVGSQSEALCASLACTFQEKRPPLPNPSYFFRVSLLTVCSAQPRW